MGMGHPGEEELEQGSQEDQDQQEDGVHDDEGARLSLFKRFILGLTIVTKRGKLKK